MRDSITKQPICPYCGAHSISRCDWEFVMGSPADPPCNEHDWEPDPDAQREDAEDRHMREREE